jgi:hypothetical protein
MKSFSSLQEDLRKWFSKTDPAGDWKRINSKGEAIGPCAREPGEPKPKCMSRAKRESLTKKERASAVRAKRKHDPNPERKGEPINVSNFGKGKISENMENLNEKNVPTNPSLWSQAKSLARSKFDVYPSAYANGWASKWYKSKGGSWKSVSEAVKDKYDEGEYDQEGDMAKSDLRSIIANAQKMHDMIDDADNLPEWVQSKITLAEDYISTVANYMAAEMSEETNIQESGGPIVFKKGDDHIEKYGEDSFALYKDGKKAKYYTSLKSAKESMKEEFVQEGIKDEPHEIVHKDTGKTVSTHKNYKDAYSAYQDLSKASDHAIGHIPKKTNEQVKPITELSSETLDRYKEKAKKSSDSLTSQGKYRQANDRTMNVMKATGKQIDKTVANIRKSLNREEVVQEGRPSQRHPLEGHEYHKKSNDALVHIAKDAHAAAEAMKSHNTTAENKYRDQASDSATVRYFRQKNGMPEWYKKKYGHVKEGVVNEVMDEPNYSLSIQARQKKADVSKTVSKTNDATPAQRSLQPNNKTMVRESRRLEIVREAMIDAKKKDQKKKIEKKVEMNGSDKFQSDPELSSQVIKNNV